MVSAVAVLLPLTRQLNMQPPGRCRTEFITATTPLEIMLIPLKPVGKLQKFTLNFSGICERWEENYKDCGVFL